ncbi:MAG: NADP-dependent oxidoreductase [Thaumarchaeota archaeon]|nr:NADP-dependent oxidoreductase [Nitrososphaerota archaeon]
MRAVAIDRFVGPEILSVSIVPVPEPKPSQILIRVESAGLGIWDVAECQGIIARMQGINPDFPWVLGSEGAGKVVAVGDQVSEFRRGDSVYGLNWGTNPKRGFFAEYTALDAAWASPIPSNLSTEQAGALMIDGATGLRGLDEILGLKQGEKLMVFGASGGIGHLAVQLATRMGAHVFAIASGEDGVALAQRLGAEGAVEGHHGDIVASAREFAPEGFDAALFTAGGDAADRALTTMRDGGRAATPGGPQVALKVPSTVRLLSYNDREYWKKGLDLELIGKLNELVDAGPFEVHLGKTFPLDQVVDAHQALSSHYLGRLALLPGTMPAQESASGA